MVSLSCFRLSIHILRQGKMVYKNKKCVCVCACATRKLDFRVGCHAAQCGGKWALGASDQSVHQFTGTLEGLLLLFFFFTCLHLLFVTFPLSHHFPLPIAPVLLFFLPWCEPSVTLMKRHVLCDSPLPNQ